MATKSNEEIQADAPFEINDYHKKALVVLLRCHFENIEISYLDLSSEMKAAEKTKAWQCVAWKELRSNEYVVHGSEKKMWKLSDGKGVELAKTFADDEMLADFKTPLTNEEHHAKIKSKLSKVEKASKLGPKIFDYFIEQNRPMTKDEVAAHFKTVPDAHHFFYGFQGTYACFHGPVCTKCRIPALVILVSDFFACSR